MRQLVLDLPDPPPVYDPAAFVTTAVNAGAVALARRLAASPAEPAFAICGAHGSGKTHLLHALGLAPGPEIIPARIMFADAPPPPLSGAPVVAVDDMQGAYDRRRALERIEGARAAGMRLILVGQGAPTDWADGLRDLMTRLAGLPRIDLPEPDDDLLAAVIRQQFRTRHLRAAPGVARYAAPRIPATFAAAAAFVTQTQKIAAETSSSINLGVAKKAIGTLFEPGDSR